MILLVEWVDATTKDGWSDVEGTCFEPDRCRNVGFLLRENDFYLVLAGSLSENQCNSVMTIPKGCITKREIIWIDKP